MLEAPDPVARPQYCRTHIRVEPSDAGVTETVNEDERLARLVADNEDLAATNVRLEAEVASLKRVLRGVGEAAISAAGEHVVQRP